MSGFPYAIATTPPGALKLTAGEKATFSFTLTSLAGPDRAHELVLVPLWIGPDRKGIEVDWLAAGPADGLRMAGGETATVTITARPSATSPLGEQTLKLRVARKDDPNELYVDSPPVICEVLAPPLTPPVPVRRRWWIPAIIAGAVVLAGAGAAWAWLERDPPPPGEIAIGSACDPDDKTVRCAEGGLCDPASKTCVREATGCKPGTQQCTQDGAGINTCDDAGAWNAAPCPASTPQCRDGKCQCVSNLDHPCGDCDGKIQCDGSCSKPNPDKLGQSCGDCGGKIQCNGLCDKPNPDKLGQSCGDCGGKIQCNGLCDKPNPDKLGQSCSDCGGKIQCNGLCDKPNPDNLNQQCGQCRGVFRCDGSCSVPTPADWDKPCGECDGRRRCDGSCSITTPLCQPGFVPDATARGYCRSTGEAENYNVTHSFGGALWDKCDPCGGPLNTHKTISMSCGVGRVRSSFDIRWVAGPRPGDCSGAWANPGDPNDCSVRIHIKTSALDNFKCGVVIKSVERRRQCTN
jgi:hypothetical protein